MSFPGALSQDHIRELCGKRAVLINIIRNIHGEKSFLTYEVDGCPLNIERVKKNVTEFLE